MTRITRIALPGVMAINKKKRTPTKVDVPFYLTDPISYPRALQSGYRTRI